jgi:type II secretory pathway component GspD/PulD (secretin)
MNSRRVVWLVLVSILAVLSAAQCAADDTSAAKSAAVIAVKHVLPSRLMLLFGLTTREDYDARKVVTWLRSSTNADDIEKMRALMPDGIDAVTPYDSDNNLIVYGTEDGIDSLRKIIEMLDVAPRQIQIRSEFYHLTREQAGKIIVPSASDSATGSVITCTDQDHKIESALQKNNISPLESPTVIAINNEPALLSIKACAPVDVTVTEPNSSIWPSDKTTTHNVEWETSLEMTPRVNGDDTITLLVNAKVPSEATLDKPAQNVSLKMQRRVSNGESLVLYRLEADKSVWMVVVTPTLIKDAASPS